MKPYHPKLKTKQKHGGILLAVMIILFVISFLIMGMLSLQQKSATEMARSRQSKQAFWLAEAGLGDAIQALASNIDGFRDNPANFTKSFGNGSYAVTVVDFDVWDDWDNWDTDYGIPVGFEGATNYTLKSVGQLRGQKRTIRQFVATVPGSKFVITSKGGISSFNSEADVNGGGVAIYASDGDPASIDSGNNAGVNIGELYVTEGVTVTGHGAAIKTPMSEGLSEPELDVSSYITAFNGVANSTGSPVTEQNLVNETSIAGSINYGATNVTYRRGISVPSGSLIQSLGNIEFRSAPSFDGPVTIYAGGNVVLANSSVLPEGSVIIAAGSVDVGGGSYIGDGVEITAGLNVDIGNQMNFGREIIVYAHQNLTAAAGIGVSSSTEGVAFLANGDVTLASNFNVFRGIIFANGTVNLSANIDVHGVIVGGDGFHAASNVEFFYDPTAYNWALESSGVKGLTLGDYVAVKGRWKEIPSE